MRVYGQDLVIAGQNYTVRYISLPELLRISTADPHFNDRSLPRRSFELFDYSSCSICLPSSIPRDSNPHDSIDQLVPIWHVGWVHLTAEGYPLSTVGLTKSSLDPSQPWAARAIARPLTTDLLPLPTPVPPPSSEPSTSSPSSQLRLETRYSSAESLRHNINARVAAYYSQAGVERVLSLVTSNNSPHDGLVLTDSSPWGGLQHKALYIREEGSEKQVDAGRVKLPKASGEADTTRFWWSEMSGKIVVRIRDEERSFYEFRIYEFI